MSDRRKDDRERAMQHLSQSIESLDSKLGDDNHWRRCKRLISRIMKVVNYDWAVLPLLPYREYLATQHWEMLRKRALESAKHRCQTCNSRGELHTHHRTYESIGSEELSDLIVLCSKCHKLFHDNATLSDCESEIA